MKNRNLIVPLSALFVITNTNAQFFDKLKKRAEEAAKEALTRKVEKKNRKGNR